MNDLQQQNQLAVAAQEQGEQDHSDRSGGNVVLSCTFDDFQAASYFSSNRDRPIAPPSRPRRDVKFDHNNDDEKSLPGIFLLDSHSSHSNTNTSSTGSKLLFAGMPSLASFSYVSGATGATGTTGDVDDMSVTTFDAGDDEEMMLVIGGLESLDEKQEQIVWENTNKNAVSSACPQKLSSPKNKKKSIHVLKDHALAPPSCHRPNKPQHQQRGAGGYTRNKNTKNVDRIPVTPVRRQYRSETNGS